MKLFSLQSVRTKLIILSLMHFATDGLCAYLVFSKLYTNDPLLSFLVFVGYNLLAFVTQSPLGILIDKFNKPKQFLFFSVVTMLLGYAFSIIPILAIIFIGISNSFFHVVGGKYITVKSGNDISFLGIFVSTGAVGLVIGQRYFELAFIPYLLFTVFILCFIVIFFSQDSEDVSYNEVYVRGDKTKYALLAVMGAVFFRSFIGKVVIPDFDPSEHTVLIIALATALGKAVGGVLSKRIGVKITTCLSMVIATLGLTLGVGNIYTFAIGIFAFNFSMPITLYLANIILKGKEGFAFGTLAAALAPGYFLAMSFTYSPVMHVCVALMCVISMLAVILVSRRIGNFDKSCNTDRPA